MIITVSNFGAHLYMLEKHSKGEEQRKIALEMLEKMESLKFRLGMAEHFRQRLEIILSKHQYGQYKN